MFKLFLLSFLLVTYFSFYYINKNCILNAKLNEKTNYSDVFNVLGIEKKIIKNILNKNLDKEYVIAEFDQNNRIVSYIGEIPYFSGISICSADFKKRKKSKVELVIYKGKLLVRKKYSSIKNFVSETIALYVLSDIKNVPDLISIKLFKLLGYHSFIIGENIGSKLASNGITVSDQYQLDVHYPGPKQWNYNNLSETATVVRESFQKITDKTFIKKIQKLVLDLHKYGIIINDLKYGNLIDNNNEPYIIDFDRSSYYYFFNSKYSMKRNAELDKFNYVFSDIIHD